MPKVKMDRIPRYVPDRIAGFSGPFIVHAKVLRTAFHPAGTHKSPIMAESGALEIVTASGTRWFGVEKAYINSTLRMVAVGFPAAFEEMAKWEKVPQNALT